MRNRIGSLLTYGDEGRRTVYCSAAFIQLTGVNVEEQTYPGFYGGYKDGNG